MLSTNGRLAGKRAIITGGTQGIGRATAERFLAEGARVVITGRDPGRGEDAERSLSPLGEIRFVRQDVASETDWKAVMAATDAAFGGLDVLVNNAAASVSQTIAQSSVEEFQAVIATNLTSVFIGMKLAAEAMLKGQGGAIINLSSVAAGKGHAVLPAYTAAKTGLEGLTRCAVREYGEAGQPIRANIVRPGYIQTDLSVEFLVAIGGTVQGGLDIMAAQHPIGFTGLPADVAGLIVYLASDDARFVTGGVFSIDGGYQT